MVFNDFIIIIHFKPSIKSQRIGIESELLIIFHFRNHHQILLRLNLDHQIRTRRLQLCPLDLEIIKNI